MRWNWCKGSSQDGQLRPKIGKLFLMWAAWTESAVVATGAVPVTPSGKLQHTRTRLPLWWQVRPARANYNTPGRASPSGGRYGHRDRYGYRLALWPLDDVPAAPGEYFLDTLPAAGEHCLHQPGGEEWGCQTVSVRRGEGEVQVTVTPGHFPDLAISLSRSPSVPQLFPKMANASLK